MRPQWADFHWLSQWRSRLTASVILYTLILWPLLFPMSMGFVLWVEVINWLDFEEVCAVHHIHFLEKIVKLRHSFFSMDHLPLIIYK